MYKPYAQSITLLLTLTGITSGYAEIAQKNVFTEPPLLKITRPNYSVTSGHPMIKGLGVSNLVKTPSAHDATLAWKVAYTDSRIWNPSTQQYDKVHLRSYQGTDINHDVPFVAPTIKIFPGETIRASLSNQLPNDPSCEHTTEVNTPHCFNGTNMHTHGLWINPAGNSDNVLISINPGVDFQYEYNIPTDHPAGTFWYHPHRHGSTALQVASGMAGALIIQGNRQPSESKNGDIDTLLQATETQSFKERTLVFQQIQYACYKPGDEKNPNAAPKQCDNGDVGIIENYNNFGPGSWANSGRYTSINGQVQPNFENAKVGQVERWRMIHAGIRDSINLQFRKLKDGVQLPAGMKAEEHDSFIAQNCTGEPIQQNMIAADGLTTAQIKKTTESVFQPGYRWDALMLFPEAGKYCIIDNSTSAKANVTQAPSPRQLLGLVNVAPNPQATGSIDEQLQTALIDAAQKNIDPPIRQTVIADIKQGALTKFVPHSDIATTQGKQNLEFNINTETTPTQFLINNKPYDPNRIDRNLILGSSDEWVLTSKLASHPFHIHVNPFQIVKILDPNGNDVSGVDAIDNGDPQYPGLKDVWKDTVWVKQGYQVVVRSRYERYIGDFVLHCHILDHEDQGMMQSVRISLPGGDAHH